MSDTGRTLVPPRAAGTSPTAGSQPDPQRWHELVAQMGAEIAAPLTAALERINTLTSTGRIDRRSLRSLREEVESARQAGMIGQQLTRFASGRLRQSHERLQLTKVLDSVLSHRTRETRARGISVRPSLRPAEVIVDASLLFSLLNSTIDWALANAGSHIDFSVDMTHRPTHARLACCFARRPTDDTAGRPAGEHAGMESLTWRLLEQTAWTMGLMVEREDEADVTTLTLEFPRTAGNEIDGLRTMEIDDGFAPSSNSQPLAGNHVLVIAARGEMRTQIRDALRNMSLIVDMVNSLEEAADFCREGLPHAIIIESTQNDEPFGRFRDEISAEVPEFVFIEIVEDADTFEMSGFSGSAMARVGRDAMASSLPSALMFELSKSL